MFLMDTTENAGLRNRKASFKAKLSMEWADYSLSSRNYTFRYPKHSEQAVKRVWGIFQPGYVYYEEMLVLVLQPLI